MVATPVAEAEAASPGTPPSLFAAVLGERYQQLPLAVRAFHDAELPARFHGEAQVRGASGRLARFSAWLAGLPRFDGSVAVTVRVERRGEGEHWHRDFGGVSMHSNLSRDGALISERLGLLRFRFHLAASEHGIDWQVRSVRLLGLPLPLRLFRAVRARESQVHGRYRFEIAATVPVLGHIVAYDGWLESRR